MKTMQSKQNHTTKIIVMLGARLSLHNGDSSSMPFFPLLNKADKEGADIEVSGGDSRMRAIALLYEKFLNGTKSSRTKFFRILTTGGIEKIRETNGSIFELSRADEAAKKLHWQYGIPEEIIESLPSGGSTIGNAEAVTEWLSRHEEISEIEIVTNRFHMLRAWLLFTSILYEKQFGKFPEFPEGIIDNIKKTLKETIRDKDHGDAMALKAVQSVLAPVFQDMRVTVWPVVVEDILLLSTDHDRRYARMIEGNPFMQEARESNRRGILRFLHGTYQTK